MDELTADDFARIQDALSSTYCRDELKGVLVVDGYNVSLRVDHNHLIITDGIGRHKRVRQLTRSQRIVKRIVILGQAGLVTLDAIRFCSDLEIVLCMVDEEGNLTALTTNDVRKDSRLKRAQALATVNGYGTSIAKSLLTHKLTGQRSVLLSLGADASPFDDFIDSLTKTDDSTRFMKIEASAATAYFEAWSVFVTCQFSTASSRRVPTHWTTFKTRKSALDDNRSPRKALCPINALLNYTYALGEVECRYACAALGLDPTLGVLHTDQPHRDSLALDLLEVIRPYIDAKVLELLRVRRFSHLDFIESRQGECRLSDGLTHTIAEWLPEFAHNIAPIAESIAHTLAESSVTKVKVRTPLTSRNRLNGRPDKTIRTETVMPSCQVCGKVLTNRRRKFCSPCAPN